MSDDVSKKTKTPLAKKGKAETRTVRENIRDPVRKRTPLDKDVIVEIPVKGATPYFFKIATDHLIPKAATPSTSISEQWATLAEQMDLAKVARLHSEALKAKKIQQQSQALKILNWDEEKWKKYSTANKPSTATVADKESLEAEIRRLSELLTTQIQTVLAEKKDAEGKDRRIAELNKTLEELRQREGLAFLINQVHPAAQPLLEADETFRNSFVESKDCTGFVLSVDIRRSTDLMLKARSPEQFATFIGDLTSQLTEVVLESFGVFDKFTGDGILAFFPDFYSGEDAGFHALTVAQRCHEVFEKHYRECRSAFTSIIQDTGLGIGIDFGRLHLVQVAGAITVVGSPVVYACRMGGAPAGVTLLNQPAFEVLSDRYGLYFSFTETSLDFKHEGKTLAYAVSPNSKIYIPEAPKWFNVHSSEMRTKT